jgi:hypothetical protein
MTPEVRILPRPLTRASPYAGVVPSFRGKRAAVRVRVSAGKRGGRQRPL